MKKFLRRFYRKVFRNRFLIPIVEFKPQNILRYISFFADYLTYRRMTGGKERLYFWPRLGEKTRSTPLDPQYFYQGVWAAEKVFTNKPNQHVDIGSQADLIGFLTTITQVKFIDLRPLPVKLRNLENIKGTILNLPFIDSSVASLSCLHVAEHIGLGRYGDRIDPQGTQRACAELSRVLARGGHLYFSLPIGVSSTYFNAHRIHDPATIRNYFSELQLVEFSAVDDHGAFIRNANMEQLRHNKYSCGLFHFVKPQESDKKILMVKLGAAGDVIRTTALLPGLKEVYPGARIHWLTRSSMTSLLQQNPHIEGILSTDDDTWRHQNFDLVINLDDDAEACKITSQIKTKKVIGAYQDGDSRNYTPETAAWFDMSLISKYGKEQADVKKRENRKTFQQISYEMLGMPYRTQEPYIPLNALDSTFAEEFARAHNLRQDDFVIGINPGSGKRWVDKRLKVSEVQSLVQKLRQKYPFAKILLLGGSEEHEYHTEILNACQENSIIDTGLENSLGQFAGLINLCRVLITSDSLALHIGTALKKRVVAFFCPTSPWEIELYGNGVRILPLKGCLACYKSKCDITPEFDIDEIVQAV
jgi:ADP-heptose:LPS heptosyltransferase